MIIKNREEQTVIESEKSSSQSSTARRSSGWIFLTSLRRRLVQADSLISAMLTFMVANMVSGSAANN